MLPASLENRETHRGKMHNTIDSSDNLKLCPAFVDMFGVERVVSTEPYAMAPVYEGPIKIQGSTTVTAMAAKHEAQTTSTLDSTPAGSCFVRLGSLSVITS